MVYVGVINKEGDNVKLNITTLRDWSAVVTDTLYGLLAGAIFVILIPELSERAALTLTEHAVLSVLFAILAGSHLGTALLNAFRLIQREQAAH